MHEPDQAVEAQGVLAGLDFRQRFQLLLCKSRKLAHHVKELLTLLSTESTVPLWYSTLSTADNLK